MLFHLLIWLNFVNGDGQYECGEHGRFEYCIDEIPGCVIGCHCHPGYYFDTDSKICEPNIRLTQNFRRNFHTNEPIPITTEVPVPVEVTETLPIQDPVNNQVEEITKNADDLGDWLYNQFFKTIENEVINKTIDKNPTRRNGSPLVKNLSRRKSPRKKSKRVKKKRTKSSMRRKLLRITENDSVFDSSSEESRSDSSDSSSEDSDGSFEYHEEKEDKHKDDKQHGHKKIVIINKKPKPPLPSFIFLPNMDTPFYPPIGLPPPPILPMYPLVPVPPMPAFPCPDQDQSGSTASTVENKTTRPAQTTASETTVQTTTLASSTVSEQNPITTDPLEASESPQNLVRGGRNKKRSKLKTFQKPNVDNRFVYRNPIERQRGKMRPRQKNRNPVSQPISEDKVTPFVDDNGFDDTLNNEIQVNPDNNDDPRLENVDFKYISELIHRVKQNNTRNPTFSNFPSDSVEIYKPSVQHKIKQQESHNNKGTRRNDSDDSYYTNLGRQIASIIRNADTQNRQVNIEIEQTNENNENHVFFNDNSPRSYWERSVRSPIKFLNSNKNRFDYLKRSNELLFDIENKVSIVASTVPSLTLQEIENMINVVEKAQRKIRNNKNGINNVEASTSTKNFNVKLWPPEQMRSKITQTAPSALKISNNNQKNVHEVHGLSMHNFQRFTAWFGNTKRNNTLINNKPYTNTRTDHNNIINPVHFQAASLSHVKEARSGVHPNNEKITQYPTKYKKSFYSMLPNYKYNSMDKKKYFQDVSSVRESDQSIIPMKHVIHQIISKPTVQRPSYFHQDINQFHYFER